MAEREPLEVNESTLVLGIETVLAFVLGVVVLGERASPLRLGAVGLVLPALQGKLAGISARHRGAKVAQTEPLAGYLITAAGLVDASPPGFTAAVENGQSPSAADRAKLEDLLTSHTAKALLYNAQAVNPVTTAVADTARRAGVPVVTLTESLPVGVTTYAQWQGAQIDALARALGS